MTFEHEFDPPGGNPSVERGAYYMGLHSELLGLTAGQRIRKQIQG